MADRRIVISVNWSGILNLPDDLTPWGEVEVIPRTSDWGLTGLRKRTHHVTESLRVLRGARGAHALIICNSAIEILLAALLQPVLCRGVQLVAMDFLTPRKRPASDVALRLLRRYQLVFCIRSGDMGTLARRFNIERDRLRFVPFPAVATLSATSDEPDGGFVYSGGQAHRDWVTAVEGISRSGAHAIVSTDATFSLSAKQRETIDHRPAMSPDDAREVVRSASIVAIICEPTELPSGPLVLLDALALGKAVVATDVYGTRDYIRDGQTALVIPPHDADALAAAITRLQDPVLRRRLGSAAREACETEFTPEVFAETVLGGVRGLAPRRSWFASVLAPSPAQAQGR